MLSQESLEALLTRHGVSPGGRAYIQRVRNSPPSRLVASGIRNVTGRFPSRKMGRTIQT